MSYESFAAFYDSLQTDVDYDARAEYLSEIFKKYDRLPTLLLDVACGTGGFSYAFTKKGIEVIGADPSPEMLNIARQKFYNSFFDVLLLCQSAEELDLFGTVDGAICCLDSINHIIDEDALARSFKRIALFLEKDRLFVFDVNTEFKHRNILSGSTFVVENDNVLCVWRNSDCDNDGVVDISLDFFSKTANGQYERSFEDFSERAYSHATLSKLLRDAGLEILAVLDDMSMNQPTAASQRVIYVTRRV